MVLTFARRGAGALLTWLVGLLAVAMVFPMQMATAAPTVDPHPVLRENRLQGTTLWQIPWSGNQLATDTGKQIKGYASAASVNIGERIDLKVSAASSGAATWHLFRLGWYGGTGGRQVTRGSFTAAPQPACPMSSSTGERACSWATAVSIDVPTSWTSGQYVVVLTKGGFQNYVVFTVRDDARTADVALVQPVNTYQAYNNFPDDGTGKSLYGYHSSGGVGAVKVSFNRPYANHGGGHLFKEDSYTTRYLESRGVDVKYATSVDMDADSAMADSVKSLVFPGHDEYWTGQQFTAAETARDAGKSLAFLGANDVYWQVRYENSRRTLVCYRDAAKDPVAEVADKSILFRETGRPEQPLIGMMWPPSQGMVGPIAAWVVDNPAHWFYRGTRMAKGAAIPNMVGVEADRRVAGYPTPVGSNYSLLARSPYPVRNVEGVTAIQEATMYEAPSGAQVFGAGTITYGFGIGHLTRSDARAQTMTGNLVARMNGAALEVETDRYAGPDRYDTAAAASAATFAADSGGTAYLATGTSYPDALGSSAATQGDGPVLLVRPTEMPPSTLAELERLKPSKIVVAGDTGAVSDAVLQQAAEATGVTPIRRGGADRYATAAAVSSERFAPGVPVAYVATGLNFPDALAAGTAGAQTGGPVLLSRATTIPPATLAELTRLKPQRIVVAGGDTIVTDAVLTELRKIAPTVRRSGANRYETSLELMRDARGRGGKGTVALATGADYADALAAGPVVAANGGSLVLLPTAGPLSVAGAEEIVRTDPSLLVAVGDVGVVSAAALTEARRLFDVADGTPTAALQRGATPDASDIPAAPEAPLGTIDEPTDAELREAYRERSQLPWLQEE